LSAAHSADSGRIANAIRINNLQRDASHAMADSLLKQFAQSSQLGANAAYVEDLYEQYLVAPDSVGPKWKQYFDALKGREAGDVPHSAVIEQIAEAGRQARRGVVAADAGGGNADARQQGAVLKLIT